MRKKAKTKTGALLPTNSLNNTKYDLWFRFRTQVDANEWVIQFVPPVRALSIVPIGRKVMDWNCYYYYSPRVVVTSSEKGRLEAMPFYLSKPTPDHPCPTIPPDLNHRRYLYSCHQFSP